MLNDQFAANLELLTEEGKYNYVAYLLADVNGMSIKAARYIGLTRVDLAKNNAYGYCSLVKATKQLLDKVELENKTYARITGKAQREDAIVHNDYTTEAPPKVEFFDDRIEITSIGGLVQGMTQEEFFTGLSMPRNKELMRVFRDLDVVEHLGSGIPRILKAYGRECFTFSDNFLRMTFPAAEPLSEQLEDSLLLPRQELSLRVVVKGYGKIGGNTPFSTGDFYCIGRKENLRTT